MPQLGPLPPPTASTRPRVVKAAELEQRLDVLGVVLKDRRREAVRLSLGILDASEPPTARAGSPGPGVEGRPSTALEASMECGRRACSLGVRAISRTALSRARPPPASRPPARSTREWSVCPKSGPPPARQLARPLGVGPRERQPSGMLLGDAEIAERCPDPGVVALCRPSDSEMTPRASSIRPAQDEAVTVHASARVGDRRRVGPLAWRARGGPFGERERFRVTGVESLPRPAKPGHAP